MRKSLGEKAARYQSPMLSFSLVSSPSVNCLVIAQTPSIVCRSEKEKSKFQAEVYELLAQVENVTKEKITITKTVEKLEINISELHIKIEELNRTIVDITSHKQRLSQENVELIKEVQDLKVANFY